MRILIASDSEQRAAQIREVLVRQGSESGSAYSVPVELAADRASRLVPELMILDLPRDTARGLGVLRETSQTVQGLHVLVVGPATDPQLILRTLHSGAAEYLDELHLEAELTAALVRSKSKKQVQPARKSSAKVISVLGASGGSGSSTVAANLSTVLSKHHSQCALIDLRLAAGDLASMLDLNPNHTLADFSDRLDRVDQSMFDQFFAPHASGVHLLAAPRLFTQIPKVTSRVVRRAISMARARFRYVVADLDNCIDEAQVEALWQSDVILLVLRLDYTSVRNTRRTMDSLEELGIGLQRVRLVVNGYRQRKQLRVSQAEAALGMQIVHYIPNDPASANRAINRGVPVVLYHPSAKISRSLMNLAAEVNGQVE